MGSLSKILALLLVSVFVASLITFQPEKVEASSQKAIVVPEDYLDIQTAINHANDGDTIFVKAGNYLLANQPFWFPSSAKTPGESLPDIGIGLEINKSISLIGESSKNTYLTEQPSRNYLTRGIVIKANGVTLSNFTINGNQVNEAITLFSSNNKIFGNNILKAQNGVIMSSNNQLLENNISGCYIGVTGNGNNTIANNSVANNSVGIDIELSSNGVIAGNSIVNNGKGLQLLLANQTLVYQNYILNNGIGVDLVGNCSYSQIHNNQIQSNSIGIVSNTTLFLNLPEIPGIKQVTVDNDIYYNNVVLNNQSVGIFGPSNEILWDNNNIGNYWSDYNGNGSYIIDQNNIDHYPLSEQVNINSIVPNPTPSFPELSWLTILPLLLTIPIALVWVRKRLQRNV
jgi:parallel beta-helix repeat protein